MAQLIIYLSPRPFSNNIIIEGQNWSTKAERNNKKTPKKKQSHVTRVINLFSFEKDINYGNIARDICIDSGDRFYGYEIIK